MKHTPGPWTVQHPQGLTGIQVVGNGEHICSVAKLPFKDIAAEANARLIAAAPELLAALKEIIAAADGDGWKQLDPSLHTARAAIAKAEGE